MCWDNAVAESFFSTIRTELLHRHTWPTRARTRKAIFEWIEGWYNLRRRHSALGYVSLRPGNTEPDQQSPSKYPECTTTTVSVETAQRHSQTEAPPAMDYRWRWTSSAQVLRCSGAQVLESLQPIADYMWSGIGCPTGRDR